MDPVIQMVMNMDMGMGMGMGMGLGIGMGMDMDMGMCMSMGLVIGMAVVLMTVTEAVCGPRPQYSHNGVSMGYLRGLQRVSMSLKRSLWALWRSVRGL